MIYDDSDVEAAFNAARQIVYAWSVFCALAIAALRSREKDVDAFFNAFAITLALCGLSTLASAFADAAGEALPMGVFSVGLGVDMLRAVRARREAGPR